MAHNHSRSLASAARPQVSFAPAHSTAREVSPSIAAWKPGRHVFGAAAILFGVSGLASGEFATIWHPVRDTMPYRTPLAYLAGAAFLVGGVAVQRRRTAGAGLLVLAALYFLGTLLWMPRVLGFPQLFGVWYGSAEEFAPTVAALMAYAALTGKDWAGRATIVGRVLFGLCVVTFGIAHFTAVPQTAGMVPAWLPLGGRFWALATGWAMLLAGLSLVSGILAPLAARVLTALLLSFGAFVWLPIVFATPARQMSWGGLAITLAAAGAAWMMAELLGNRAPGGHNRDEPASRRKDRGGINPAAETAEAR